MNYKKNFQAHQGKILTEDTSQRIARNIFSFYVRDMLQKDILTRIHSRRMRTVRCSDHLLGGECLPGGGWCLPRGICPGKVSAHGGGVSARPPVDRMTDACENITFPELLLQTEIRK